MAEDGQIPQDVVGRFAAEDPTLRSSERVYRGLRQAILHGRIEPNTHLVELSLAAAFGVSRTPVREALKRLTAEGLVAADGTRGLVVRGLRFEDVEDVYVVREVLDGLATRLAVRRISPGELERMHILLEQMRHDLLEGDGEASVRDDLRFHEIIYRAAHNRYLLSVFRNISDVVQCISHTLLVDRERNEQVVREHEAIVAAFDAGDEDEAARAARFHVVRTRDNYARLSLTLETGAGWP